ncbi:hypothetical protein BZA77DRAFT_286886 [Pyronema omphalodes]|nr:hypothetical protein BZA77DRAFT_286886 [Pyronema omphalodes]
MQEKHTTATSTAATATANLQHTLPSQTGNVKGNTIVITGGASGLGEAMVEYFARNGANVIIGDVNSIRGESLAQKLRQETKNPHHHFIPCDVTSWSSQQQFFTTAIQLSPSHTLHTVIANAGVGCVGDFTESFPLDDDIPSPDLTTLDVNLTGVIYTTKLSLHHFRRNQKGEDKHLLFIGSMASFCSSPGVLALYTASKHAVLGWWRSQYLHPGNESKGVRFNLVCPYFVETGILPTTARVLLAGIPLARMEDVVEAAARLVADRKATGRCLSVMPEKAGGIVMVDAADFHATEPFVGRMVMVLNAQGKVEALVKWVMGLGRIFGVATVLGLLIMFLVMFLLMALGLRSLM